MYEKRRFHRNAALMQCYVSKIFHDNKRVASKIINESRQGVRLESDYPFNPGDALKIVINENNSDIENSSFDYCIGMVRWCAPQDGCCSGMYGIGVELAIRGNNATERPRGA